MRSKAWILGAVALGVAGTVAGGSGEALGKAKAWVVTALPTLSSWAGCWGNDVSDSGYIAGSWVDEYGGRHAAYWYRGTAYDIEDAIGVPEGCEGGGSLCQTVNSNGLMGGAAWSPTGSIEVATLWDAKRGTVTTLSQAGTDDTDFTGIYGINASGDAVGYQGIYGADLLVGYALVPVAWADGEDEGVLLPMGDFEEGWAMAVNSSGVAAGTIITRGDTFHAAIWEMDSHGDFVLTDLADDLPEGYGPCQAFDISEDGTVVGVVFTSDWTMNLPFTWTARDGFTILDADDGNGAAWKSVSKYAVGELDNGGAIWTNGRLDVLSLPTGIGFRRCQSINKSGLGVGFDAADDDLYWVFPQGWTVEWK